MGTQNQNQNETTQIINVRELIRDWIDNALVQLGKGYPWDCRFQLLSALQVAKGHGVWGEFRDEVMGHLKYTNKLTDSIR